MVQDNKDKGVAETRELIKLRHRMIADITNRLNAFSMNTVVSGFMEYNNKLIDLTKKGGVDKATLEAAIIMLSPFAPHMAEELWSQCGHETSVFDNTWPVYDENAMKDDEIEIPIQVNGKTRGVVTISADAPKEDVLAAAKAALGSKLQGNVIKEIYVPRKIVNLVVK
jgi:leucyl-tRNA synthetase